MILLSSILAFIAGFLFCLVCLTKCSDAKFERWVEAMKKARKEVKDE